MSKIQVLARITVNEGKLEELIEAGKTALAAVREKDPGTQRYDWYVSADKKTVTVLETYESSEAVMAHLGNVGAVLGALGGLGTMELEVFGEPSEELAAAAAAMKPKVHSTLFTL